MKKILWLFPLLGLLSAVNAQKQTKKNFYQKSNNTLLWEISGNGLKQPGYLFGTMHRLCKTDARLSDNLKQVIAQSAEIYFELDLDNMAELMGGIQFMKMRNKKKLSDLMTPEDHARLKAFYNKEKRMLPFEMVQDMQPMLSGEMFTESLMGCAEKTGMEELIMTEAKKGKKEIKGLETIRFQSSIFDTIPYEEQARDLLKYIDSSAKYQVTLRTMQENYRKQDLDKLMQMTEEEESTMSKYMDILLFNRNRNWVQQLKKILPQKRLLIAVGAAHLPGDQGVINLLRKEGYTVRAVKN
jgi:uncharacterized protein